MTLQTTNQALLAYLPYDHERHPRMYNGAMQLLHQMDGLTEPLTRPQAMAIIQATDLTPKSADNIILRLHNRRYITIHHNGPKNAPRTQHTIGHGTRFPHGITDQA